MNWNDLERKLQQYKIIESLNVNSLSFWEHLQLIASYRLINNYTYTINNNNNNNIFFILMRGNPIEGYLIAITPILIIIN